MSDIPTMTMAAWPLEMRAEHAAAYCDEASITAFLRLVARGEYPAPLIGNDCQPKWHRALLDAAINQRHGLALPLRSGNDIVDLL